MGGVHVAIETDVDLCGKEVLEVDFDVLAAGLEDLGCFLSRVICQGFEVLEVSRNLVLRAVHGILGRTA